MVGWMAAAAAGAAALYEGPVVRVYTVQTAKWRSGAHLRFAVISDLHSVLFGEGQRGLLGLLAQVQPDQILLPGDIVDEHRPPERAYAFLRGASGIAPCWYALGNHEYRTRCVPAIVRMAERCGVRVLLDEAVESDTPAGRLLVAGCEDPERTEQEQPDYDWRATIRRRFAGVEENGALKVLLAHHPEYSELYGRLGFDLAISGHAHGGQVRVPFLLNGLFAPGEGLFARYAGGSFRQGTCLHVVCRGAVVYRMVPRIYNPPEIVVLEVVGTGR